MCAFVLFAVLSAGALGCAGPALSPTVPRRNILLVSIDTLRADRVGTPLTPTLNRMAARGVQFTNARTVAPLTLPAHVSIMSGQLPPAHGARVNGTPARTTSSLIAPRLQRLGYRTGAIVGAFVLDRRFGLAEGFDAYDDAIRRDPRALDRLAAERRAQEVVDRGLAWLDGVAPSRPWFLWTHLYDPHAPYDAPGTRATSSAADAYDREVAYADTELGRLISRVEARPDASNTAIVIVGDHGESLGEHGEQTHGMLLFDPAIRVPLIVAAPGATAAVRGEPVSLIDIAPTVLSLAGERRDSALPGLNLLQVIDPEREIYAETEYPLAAGWSASTVLVQGRWKLMSSSRRRLFDLETDQAEANDVAPQRRTLVDAMHARTAALGAEGGAATVPSPKSVTVDADTAARLRALGYVSSARRPSPAADAPDAVDGIRAWTSFEDALSAETEGRLGDALSGFAALTKSFPDAPLFQSAYARVLSSAGRHRDALMNYRAAVARWPGDASLFHELAVAARNAGLPDEALRAEQAALAVDPEAPGVHNGLGLVLADAGKHAEAARAFADASRRDPTNASYLSNLGNALRATGKLDDAAAAYRRALERDSLLADAANGLGVVLVQQKRPADAIPLFEQAIAADAAFIEPQLNLGIALQESGQRERAIAQYRRVAQAAPARSREHNAARVLLRQLEHQ